MTTECYGCQQAIEWKTGSDGRKKRFNTDGTSHYCKDCQYCDRKIEWRGNQYVNMSDLKKHNCQEYFDAQNKVKDEVKEIEQTGKLGKFSDAKTPSITGLKYDYKMVAAPKQDTTLTKTAFEIQQEQKSEDIKQAHLENMEMARAQLQVRATTNEIAKNLGITLGELVTAVNELTEQLRQNTMDMINREEPPR